MNLLNWNWNSIRTKLITFMIMATIIPTTISMIISYVMTTNSLKERAVVENMNLLYQGRLNLESYLEEMNRSSLTVYSDPDFFRSLYYSHENINASGRQSATLQSIQKAISGSRQVYLYVDGKREATLFAQDIARKTSEVSLYPEIPDLRNDTVVLQPPHPLHTYGFQLAYPYEADQQVFTMYRVIERVPSTERLGILAIDLDMDFLSRISGQLFQPDHEQLYIANEDGYIMYSGNDEMLGQQIQTEWYDSIKQSGKQEGHFEYNNKIYLYNNIKTSVSDWTMIKEIPSSYILSSADKAAFVNILLIGVSLILIIAATIWISVYITAPIRELVGLMSQVKSGRMTVDISSNRKDEIGALHRRFGSMMDTINNLILQEYKLKLANRTNQLRALQAQVNPHFMNNALQTIGTLALEHGMKRIYSLISALARMMRYSMYNTDKPVTLATELDHIKDYVELQKERFENQFDFRYDVDESTLQVLIPKMLVQPLIENFFKHGMNPLEQDNFIALTSRRLSASIVQITVEDNGNGMQEEPFQALQEHLLRMEELDLEQLQVMSELETEDSSGIGLINIMTRLRLYYRGKSKFSIENNQPHGFRVVLTINVEGETDEGIDRG
ncbi:sensor histidine kinase [Paenibacillus lautus]|uniref:cache domain-containing sensor histidine kinase n=1 Tax=Paenibacillus lautus TaxID=1401 RepID=UPI00384A7F26